MKLECFTLFIRFFWTFQCRQIYSSEILFIFTKHFVLINLCKSNEKLKFMKWYLLQTARNWRVLINEIQWNKILRNYRIHLIIKLWMHNESNRIKMIVWERMQKYQKCWKICQKMYITTLFGLKSRYVWSILNKITKLQNFKTTFLYIYKKLQKTFKYFFGIYFSNESTIWTRHGENSFCKWFKSNLMERFKC